MPSKNLLRPEIRILLLSLGLTADGGGERESNNAKRWHSLSQHGMCSVLMVEPLSSQPFTFFKNLHQSYYWTTKPQIGALCPLIFHLNKLVQWSQLRVLKNSELFSYFFLKTDDWSTTFSQREHNLNLWLWTNSNWSTKQPLKIFLASIMNMRNAQQS